MFELEDEFYDLADNLRINNFDLEIYDDDSYSENHLYCTNTYNHSQAVYFGFCTPSDDVYRALNGRISAYIGDFGQWDNCIFTLPIPINNIQIHFVIYKLDRIKHGIIDDYISKYPSINTYGLR